MTKQLRPHVVLLSIILPDADGISTCKQIMYIHPETKVLLNACHISEEILAGVAFSGTKGLIMKNADGVEIEKAVLAIHGGADYFCKKACDMMLRRFIKSNQESDSELWRKEYTDREMDIVKLHISQRTVEVSRNALLKKMKVSSTVAMIVRAYKIGLIKAA
jgi:two-component system response regulator NreC